MLFIIYVSIGFGAALSEEPSSQGPSYCFKKIMGGERLVGYDVTRIIERSSVEECEEECNVYKCTFFSFGNLTDGNGTCELTTDRQISRRQDSNFDLYEWTTECAEGKPKGYEKACYRRIITGKRLHERFIRHSLPCNSLQACQHQCSIEKHFTCQGFNIRLDPAGVGRGICELSSADTAHVDPTRDFIFDPEFAYYEKDRDNGLPNCGPYNQVPNAIPPPHGTEENTIGYQPPGGPYYGGDSYGPWGSGHGTVEHGPWGSHGYGSGFYESSNPSRGPPPSFQPDTPQQGPYSGYGSGHGSGYGSGYGYGYSYGGDSQNSGFYGTGFPVRPSPSLPSTPSIPQGPYSGPDYKGGQPNQGSYGPYPGPDYKGGQPNQGSYGPYPGPDYKGGQPNQGSYGPYPGPDYKGGQPNQGSYGPYPGPDYKGGQPNQGSYGPLTPPRDPNFFRPNYPGQSGPHGYGTGKPGSGWYPTRPSTPGQQDTLGPYRPGYRPKDPGYQGGKPVWGQGSPANYPTGDRRYDKPNRVPTYIIIDAGTKYGYGYGSGGPKYPSQRPNTGYLPVRPPPPGRPPLPPPRQPPPLLPPRQPPPFTPPPGQPPPLPPPPRQPPPLLPPPNQPSPPRMFPGPEPSFGISSNTIGREVCFRREHPGYKLNPDTIKGMYETPTVLDCEAMCTNSPFKCTGYSFRYSTDGSGPNCLLTDYTTLNPQTHLLPDRSCDVYFKMGTCMEFERSADTECFLKVASNKKLDSNRLMKMMSVSGMSDCELACLNSGFFTCRSFSYRHGPPVIGEPIENCFLSDWPMSALTHADLIPAASYEVYERGSFGHGCELDMSSAHIGPKPPFTPYPNIPQITFAKDPWGVEETWRHFTVSGWPCRSGTQCELNPMAGFWSCEVEGGDHAQWDYCCRPKHSCGFSKGYHYPWCYVGEAGPDQWRPCSEYYYPDFSNRYQYKPVKSHNPHPVDSYGPSTDLRPWDFGSEEFGPPSSWPISYVYSEPPPNETYIWDSEEYHFYPDDSDHPPEHHHHHHHDKPEDSPRIRFKPCGHRHPYPRAIVQKLDLKNIPKAGNPEEQSQKDQKPKTSTPKTELGFSPDNREKKNSVGFFPSAVPNGTERAKETETNGTHVPVNKTKEVIKAVEKIIMESSAGAEPEKNESLKHVETKHPGFFSLSLLEQPDVWQ